MAYRGKVIFNPYNRQTIEFVTTSKDSRGDKLEMISTWHTGGAKPIPHYHPNQDEHVSVIEGELSVMINGQKIILVPGRSLHIPRNAVHSTWNESNEPVIAEWKVSPALQTEYILETMAHMAASNKLMRKASMAGCEVDN